MPRPFDALRARKVLTEINPRYQAVLAAGVPLATYPGETLQCRNELDRTNWMELRDICRQAITDEKAYYAANALPNPAAGWGAGQVTAPGIRTTSNAYIRPSVAVTLTLLGQVSTWALTAQANWWRLKDAARDAPTRDALNAIDVGAGWP